MPTKTTKAPSATKPAAKRAATESHPLEGKKAPSFDAVDESGEKVSLKSLLAGGNLVLYFYPKDMTPGCTTEACDFRDNSVAIKKAGAQVVGVSADSSASHQKFIGKHELNFRLLADTDNKITKAYGVYQQKSLYGREFMGIVRSTFIIDSAGIVRKVFPKVKVTGHTEEVLEALKALG